MEISPRHRELIATVRPHLQPWRKFTLAIDGVDSAGKSTLARFMAWQLGMPAIETDLALERGTAEPTYDYCMLTQLIHTRHALNRPVIVEGVFVLRSLAAINVTPDFLVRVEASGCEGSYLWHSEFVRYAKEYPQVDKPDFVFSWVPDKEEKHD